MNPVSHSGRGRVWVNQQLCYFLGFCQGWSFLVLKGKTLGLTWNNIIGIWISSRVALQFARIWLKEDCDLYEIEQHKLVQRTSQVQLCVVWSQYQSVCSLKASDLLENISEQTASWRTRNTEFSFSSHTQAGLLPHLSSITLKGGPCAEASVESQATFAACLPPLLSPFKNRSTIK